MYYSQKSYYEPIGEVAYTDLQIFHFKCELMSIVNDKIRIHYWIPINDPKYKGVNQKS